jgi:hypothetical protein
MPGIEPGSVVYKTTALTIKLHALGDLYPLEDKEISPV